MSARIFPPNFSFLLEKEKKSLIKRKEKFHFVGSPLTEIVYLDTFFVWEVYNPHADPIRQAQCAAFVERLNQAGVMMVINSWVIQELRHIILVGVYRQEAQSRRMGWLELFRQSLPLSEAKG